MKRILLTGIILMGMPIWAQQINQVPLRATYDRPATDWQSEALPLGNGYMGAMVYGGVSHNIIQTNEHTLWSGGPGEDPSYDGGHLRTPAENRATLQKVRSLLQQRMNDFTANKSATIVDGKVVAYDYNRDDEEVNALLRELGGTKTHFGTYQSVGTIDIMSNDAPVLLTGSITTDCDNANNASEGVQNLFDGNIDSKWFADGSDFRNLGAATIDWSYASAPNPTAYTMTSANDAYTRDPYSWTLYASVDGMTFKVIANHDGDRDGQTWGQEERNTTKTFELDADAAKGCRFFRMKITDIYGLDDKYPQLAEISLNHSSEDNYSDYKRVLDIDNSTLTESFKVNGVTYTREYFMSYPDNVFVMRISADRPGALDRTVSINTPHSDYTLTAEGNTITLTGYPTPNGTQRVGDAWKNGLRFAQQLTVIPDDGIVEVTNGNMLSIDKATAVTLIMSAATNYIQCMDATFNYFDTQNPLEKVKSTIANAVNKGYDALRSDHIADYTSLYDRNKIDLGAKTVPAKTTDSLIEGFAMATNSKDENLYLQTLYYQFGRYLLISSSRPGTLPANLQGVWADGLSAPWDADYHTNINVQMNYWPAEVTNLAECHEPLFDYINSMVPRGKITANYYYCRQDGGDVRGWTTNHEQNIWGNTAPSWGTYYDSFYFPAGGIWLCLHMWEHYLYTQDKEFLRANYDTMLGAALFWLDTLWEDERDNTLVANPSFSPEHGAFSLGCSTFQAMIWEIFNTIDSASSVLGRNDDAEIKEIKEAMSRLSMPAVGLGGQFMEWKDEVNIDLTGDNHHRHTNHLFWLHPGTYIVDGRSEADNKFTDAMRVTLNTRGDDGTGWSRVWKMNHWARLHDGNRAYTLLRSAMNPATATNNQSGVYPNLFDAHPPFQIDGNFGFTAGVAEMLMQTHGGYIELLPALPDFWNRGGISGLKARGGFEIDLTWADNTLRTLTITSEAGNDCTLRYENAKDFEADFDFEVIDDNTVRFKTVSGQTYDITYSGTREIVRDEYKGTPYTELYVPGKIEAEDFDCGGQGVAFNDTNPTENKGGHDYRTDEESKMVDIEYVDGSGNVRLCWMDDSKWWKYTFTCLEEGSYDLSICITGQQGSTGRVTAIIDDIDEYGTPDTQLNGWDSYINLHTFSTVNLSAGKHVMQIRPHGPINLDWYQFTKSDISGIISPVTSRPVIASGQGNIIVLNHEGEVKVYTIAGTMLHSGVNEGPIYLSPGVYVVKAGDMFGKVIVK